MFSPAVLSAAPRLFLGEAIYATPDIEFNVYFQNATDAIRPNNFAWNVICEKGRHEEERWMYKPMAEECRVIGRENPLALIGLG